MRAFLTLLGVMIGVMTIISTTTVLGGIRYRVTSVMENSLATNVFQVQQHDDNQGIHMGPNRRDRRPKLVPELADAIKERCPAVKAVGVETWEFGWTLERGSLKSNPNQQIAGGSIEFAKNNGYNVAMGRPITQQDIDANRHVMVMGWNAYKKLFDRMNPIGEFVKLKGEKFEIIGVFEERGSVMGESLDNDNWMPLPIWQRMYGTRRSVNLTVQAWNTALYDEAQEEVIEALRSERGLKPGEKNNFAMWTPDSRRQSFDKISQAIGLAAFGICGISLLVAGIGIMNIMLVSVTERTREIGLRKALGGTKASILRQFLIEAFMLSQVGGLIGILLGYFIAVFINQFLKFPAPIPMWSVTLSIIFCSVIGIGFGMWPAIRAARLDPIDALRYE
jgi:putative ABC transport system permease protein